MKRRTLIIGIILSALVMTGIHPAESIGADQKKYSMATGGTGGTFYFVGAGISNLLHKYEPDIDIVVEATSASPENARLVSRGRADFALTTAEHSYTAYTGTGIYGSQEKGNVLFIRNSHIAYFQIVTNNPDIKTVYDLKGKKIAFGAPGSTTYLSQGPALMKAHGMTYKDVKPQSLAYSEAIEAMKDKNLDAALIGAGAPTAAVIDLFNLDPKARIIPIGAAEMKKMSEFDPYCFGWELPANTYKGQTTAILQPAIAQILVVNKNVPDDVVYRMTKAIDQKRNELVKSHGVFKEWSHKSAFLGRHIPFHPGAEKYWREVKLIK